MEMRVSLAAVAIVSGVCLIICRWIWRILNWVWLNPKKQERLMRHQGFAGNTYRFLVGDLKDHFKLRETALSHPISFSNNIIPRVVPFLRQTLSNYGVNSFTWVGPTIRVLISDPEQVKLIFANFNEFQRLIHPNPLAQFLATGVAAYEGEKWDKHRKMIHPSFHIEKLKKMLPAMEESCIEVIKKWETMVSEGKPWEVDVWPELRNITRDAISRTAFGSSVEEGKRIFELITELSDLLNQVLQTVYIPGWRFLPTKMNKRLKAAEAEIQELVRGLISKREKAMERGEESYEDLLETILQSNQNETEKYESNKSNGLSIDDVVSECKLFYLAGQETTSDLLVWTMILLSANRQWQERAREEVFQVLGKNRPTFDGLSSLKVVNMILYEVLRLYPPAQILSRMVHRETRLGDLTLSAGSLVIILAIFMQHDPKIWGDDALDFNPERFSEGVSKATNNQTVFFPFGGGPQICIGKIFAMIDAKLALSMILQRFSFELSPCYSHAPTTILTLQPQHGAHLILHKLEH